jgi:antitoxin MazE
MTMMIRSKVVKIGNSRGIRIPRILLEQAGLTDEIEMTVEGNRLIVNAVHQPRASWDARFAEMAEKGDDHLLDETTPTQWDDNEWIW